jgi:putative heme-binding domain-containing protein
MDFWMSMVRQLLSRRSLLFLVGLWLAGLLDHPLMAQSGPGGSRLVGSPDPPHPFRMEAWLPELTFDDPMQVRWQPELQRYFVCELGGKIWSFDPSASPPVKDLVVDLKEGIRSFDASLVQGVKEVYSLAFDPDFRSNRYLYVCMILAAKDGKPFPAGSRISRFVVQTDSIPSVDPGTELPILQWQSGGHNGCDLVFDSRGCLLVSTGDATDPSPPDGLATGQDISDLLGSILRLDVRAATKDQPYRVPEDNPFVGHPGARGEVWAYGFRNPWRMAIDPSTGRLWLGDVGWEKWEMVQEVVAGGNYGWSVREGEELLRPQLPVGPTPILPPRVALPHSDAASVTGGFVYRGDSIPRLNGQYVFGDWVTGRLWSLPIEPGGKHQEIAQAPIKVVAIVPGHDGDVLVVHHGISTPLFRLVENEQYEAQLAISKGFPQRLSQTGLFEDLTTLKPESWVVPFEINHPMWQDHAQSIYHLALPEGTAVLAYSQAVPLKHLNMFGSRLHFPLGSVLAKTIERDGRRLETQLLHFDEGGWRGYSYVWNDRQDEAILAPAEGLSVATSRGAWRVASRSECLQCHNPWSETTLAFQSRQLHRIVDQGASEWERLSAAGAIRCIDTQGKDLPPADSAESPLSHSKDAPLDHRARSYLHVNCAHCHQFGGGSGLALSLRIVDPLESLKGLDVMPEKGGFGIADAKIFSRGRPEQSALVYRLASSSIGRMPHLGSREIDGQAVALVSQWIESLGQAPTNQLQSQELASLMVRANALAREIPQDPSARRSSALRLAVELWGSLDSQQRQVVSDDSGACSDPAIRRLAEDPDPLVATLFEGFLPPPMRIPRVSQETVWGDLSSLAAAPERGRLLFVDRSRLQCLQCHQLGQEGFELGPRLDGVGSRLTASQIFEALHDPNRQITPSYQTHALLHTDGSILQGLIRTRDGQRITLATAKGTLETWDASDLSEIRELPHSLMPSGLTLQMTGQEVADLVAYLVSLK